MLTETASATTTTIHNDPTSGTPIVEMVGSTPTEYALDSNGTPIEAVQGSTESFLTDDPKGDVATVVGSSGGDPSCQISYDPYGTVVFGLTTSNPCETGSTFDDLLYQNSRMDSSSQTYQLGYRTYDPSKNSFLEPDHFQEGSSGEDLFLQTDPLTENAYTFVDGDPVNQFDPSGHMYTCGNDCPAGGANGVAAVQQTTHSYYATHAAAADKQQAVDNRENAKVYAAAAATGAAEAHREAVAAQSCSGFCLSQWAGAGASWAWQNKFAVGAGIAVIAAGTACVAFTGGACLGAIAGFLGGAGATTGTAAAAVGTTGAIVAEELAPADEVASGVAEGATSVNEGVYNIASSTGRYIGQSGNIAQRFAGYLSSGRFTQSELDSAQLEEELGGKVAREILEQQTIDANGGVDQLLNIRNPIGEARWLLMPQPYSR
jgi:RHS repeat-associated protein